MSRVFVHRINRHDRITYVNDEWLAFAIENDTPEITKESVLNRPLWDFIEDRETCNIYNDLLTRVRTTLSPADIPFRCDSADCIRIMRMDVIPLLDGEVQFNCTLLHQEKREPVPLFDPAAERSSELLKTCSWCKKIQLPEDGWVEPEVAIRELDLFGERRPPRLTGGICPPCNERVFGKE